MSIIKNKDIYDDSQGNPLKAITDMLDILDKKAESVKKRMKELETSVKAFNSEGNSSDAKALTQNIEKLETETKKLTEIQKAEIQITRQLESAKAKLALADSDLNRELLQQKAELSEVNRKEKESIIISGQLGNEYQRQSTILNKLRKEYKDLAIQEKQNTKEAKDLLNQITRLDAKLKQVDASVGQFQRNVGNYTSAFQRFGTSLKNFFLGGMFVAIAQRLGNFIADVGKLGAEMDGTKRAFEGLNQPGLLGELKKATGETVSDVELMKKALDADDFKVNLKDLPLYFKFARKEVQETGGSVTEMVDTIIKGLGKESPKAVAQLGIPMKQFKEELAKTGDYATALNNILRDRLGDSKYIETAADVTARWASRWENIKATAGSFLNTLIVNISPALESALAWLGKLWNNSIDFIIDFVNGWIELYNESENFRLLVEAIGMTFKLVWNSVKLFFSLMIDNLKNVGSVLAYTFNPKNWGQGFGKGLAEVLAKGGKRITDDFKEFGANTYDSFKEGFNNAKKGNKALLTRKDFQFGGGGGAAVTNEGGGGETPVKKEAEKYDAMKDPEIIAYLEKQKKAQEYSEFIKQQEQEIIDAENAANAETLKNAQDLDAALWQIEIDRAIEQEKLRDEQKKKDEQRINERNELIGQSIEFAGQQFGELAAKGELTFKEFGKTILTTALDVIEKMILMYSAEILAREVAKKSLFGIASAALLIGTVKGFFGGIKARVQAFATGTEYVNGAGTETSDSIPAMLSKGERIVDAKTNKQMMGISNKDLPSVIHNGLNTLKMERLLKQVNQNTQLAALYLSNGRNDWIDNGLKYSRDWRTGETRIKPIN